MDMCALAPKLLTERDCALVHQVSVPGGRHGDSRRENADTIGPRVASRAIGEAESIEAQPFDAPDGANTG